MAGASPATLLQQMLGPEFLCSQLGLGHTDLSQGVLLVETVLSLLHGWSCYGTGILQLLKFNASCLESLVASLLSPLWALSDIESFRSQLSGCGASCVCGCFVFIYLP